MFGNFHVTKAKPNRWAHVTCVHTYVQCTSSQEWKRTPIINTKHDQMKSNKELAQRQTHTHTHNHNTYVDVVDMCISLVSAFNQRESYVCRINCDHARCTFNIPVRFFEPKSIFAYFGMALVSPYRIHSRMRERKSQNTFQCFSYWSIAFN